nr:MAG: hypothetical protein DIU78_21755 [Pseudomonadota bacterium]
MVLGVLCVAPDAEAKARSLVAEPREGEKIRIDGDLREWPARMTPLDNTLTGAGITAQAVVGYDETNVYLALRVDDRRIARTAAAGKAEDHATLTIAFPSGKGYSTYQVTIHPGRPGKLPAVVRVNGKNVTGAKAVENPTDRGLLLEAQIPWSAFPEAKTTRVGLRASVTYTDCDTPGKVGSVVSTGTGGKGKSLGALLLEGEQALEGLLRNNGLSDVPAREAYGNLVGSAARERVAVFGRFLTITGPEYRGGKELGFLDLGVSGSGMVPRLELRDFDGDGLSEIAVWKRVGSRDAYREVLEVFKIGKDDTPFSVFAHEVGIKTSKGEIENVVRFERDAIEIAQGKSRGFDPETYDEPLAGNMPSALLPWESVTSRTFRWQGTRFVATDGGAAANAPRAVAGAKRGPSAGDGAPVQPPPPRPPTPDELLDRVYALYRKDRKVRNKKPRFDFVTDVAGDSTPERVLVHDKDIVVFGKKFRGGASYAFTTIGVSDGKDVLDVTARDLTGDGKAEILVRGVMHAKASKALGGGTVDRHALLVYGVRGDTLVRLFAAETGRSVGENQILGAVAFHPAGAATRIELRPARAIGWTEETYPFPPDTTAAGGLEPLLLPWSNERRFYRFDGNAFVPE